jgi:phosphoenolpyruvate carboxylase
MANGRLRAASDAKAIGGIDVATLGSILSRAQAQAAGDPSSNPILLFALNLTLRIDRGELALDELASLVQQLTAEAFADRAKRLASYLGESLIEVNEGAIVALIEQKASGRSFEEFCMGLARSVFGVAFTAHPTFSIALELARILVELATGQTVAGIALDEAMRSERMAAVACAEHRPPEELSLEVEHAWVTEALNHAHDVLEGVHRSALQVARKHWPHEWTRLEPRLLNLSSWVGYDQDGRTDITWMHTIAVRLADKLAMIERHRCKVEALRGVASGDFGEALEQLGATPRNGQFDRDPAEGIACGGRER